MVGKNDHDRNETLVNSLACTNFTIWTGTNKLKKRMENLFISIENNSRIFQTRLVIHKLNSISCFPRELWSLFFMFVKINLNRAFEVCFLSKQVLSCLIFLTAVVWRARNLYPEEISIARELAIFFSCIYRRKFWTRNLWVISE